MWQCVGHIGVIWCYIGLLPLNLANSTTLQMMVVYVEIGFGVTKHSASEKITKHNMETDIV